MNYRLYIVAFDKSIRSENIHKKITSSKVVHGWWHYLESVYILKVAYETTALDLTKFLRYITPNYRFVVSETSLNNSNGWLPKQAWDWIEENRKKSQRLI